MEYKVERHPIPPDNIGIVGVGKLNLILGQVHGGGPTSLETITFSGPRQKY